MTEREAHILEKRLLPIPQEFSFKDGNVFLIEKDCEFHVCCNELSDAEKENILHIAELFWQKSVRFRWMFEKIEMDSDSYHLSVKECRLQITASSVKGILNALKTIRQLAETERGVACSTRYEVAPCEIRDTPALKFRGLHICWFPETKSWQVERAVRMAAYYKYNYVVLETWGVFPFEKNPYLCWQQEGCQTTKQTLRRIVHEATALGLTVIPQFNLLGHASGSRENGGKHVIENQSPEYMSLVEPDGWTWCISNPETRRVLTECVEEMLEVFNYPEYFHIGCDEARLIGTCRTCRKQNLKDLVLNHLLYFHDLLKSHGASIMMWHDMLLNREDRRWDRYIVCGKEAEGLGEMYKEMPNDIIICDWQYDYPEDEKGNPPEWPTGKFFKEQGFRVLMSPNGNIRGISSLCNLVKTLPLFGVLETTWASLDMNMVTTIGKAAMSVWRGNLDGLGDNDVNTVWAPDTTCLYHHHLRQIENDMRLTGYNEAGRIMAQVPREIAFH